ncbi:MAG TPA: hypothetical protein VGD78_09740 [Chthoniobacterales bacterium]
MNTVESRMEGAFGAIDPALHADERRVCAEFLLEEFAVLWLGHSRNKAEWGQVDWPFEELCNRVLLFLDPGDAS